MATASLLDCAEIYEVENSCLIGPFLASLLDSLKQRKNFELPSET